MPLKTKLAGHERDRSGGCVRVNTLPVAEVRLQKIAKDACISTFQSVKRYNHSQTQEWSTKVMDQILAELVPNGKASRRPPKLIVTCTIIQYTVPVSITQTSPATAGQESVSANNFYSKGRLWPPVGNITPKMRRDLLGPAALERGEVPTGNESTADEHGGVAWNPDAEVAVFPSKRKYLPSLVDTSPNNTLERTGRYFASKALWTHNSDGLWDCT